MSIHCLIVLNVVHSTIHCTIIVKLHNCGQTDKYPYVANVEIVVPHECVASGFNDVSLDLAVDKKLAIAAANGPI